MKTPPVLTVTQLNTYIKSVIDSDLNLNNVFVQGEISNFTNHYRTGHYYMSIKDGDSSIKAVMFKYSNQRLRFMPENGMNVILRGRVSVFERDGQYQLYIDDIQPDGAGALALAFEQLKQKLASQGLFDPDKKKPIPFMPKRIGVVTSNTGAAVHDIINVISRRFPMTELVIAPVQVQGTSAAGQIAAAIREFNACNGADVLIVGRGGGSVEDLWAFNEEVVARAVYDSHIPVISAVGHETDFTICDFVADLRAPTPSAAAELAVPDWREQKLYVDALFNQCKDTVLAKIQSEEDNLRFILKQLEYANPMTVIENKIQTVDIISQKIYDKVRESVAVKSGEFAAILARLDALNPMKVMQRGYAIAYKNETAITSVSHTNKGDKLKIRLLDGAVNVTVDEREEN